AVGAGRAVELAQILRSGDAAELPAQAVGEDGQLLAHRGGGGRLAVRVRQQGYVGQLASHPAHLLDQLGRAGEPHLSDGALNHERVGEVVDVLGGAGEVHQLGDVRTVVEPVGEA